MATNALATTTQSLAQFGEMTVQTLVDRKRKMQEVMEAVMIDGVHYGKIPGCGDKPSLFKAGAEVCATVFGLAPTFKITRHDLPNGHREYEIVCTLNHIATGAVVGEGVGSCSTMESKYRWRAAERVCPNCSKATIIKGKAEYGGGWLCFAKKGGCNSKWNDGAKEIEAQQVGRVENPDLADTYNSVLKMAKKRAQVDCTLTATGASDILTQDLEDLPPGSIDRPTQAEAQSSVGEHAAVQQAKPAAPPIDETKLEDIALELIADINECKSPDAVRALAKRFAQLPKGTRAREHASAAYNKRIADTSPPVAA